MKQAVIIAGGKGTRLARALGMDIPKPMAPILGTPLLERLVWLLRDQGIRKILLLVHHRAEVIRAHFGDGSAFGVEIGYSEESEPRGTGGALLDALSLLEERFLILYGDTFVEMDFCRMLAFHEARQADLTLFVHPNDHPQDSDLIEREPDGRVLKVHPYPHPAGSNFQNLVNAALYVMERRLLGSSCLPVGAFDLAKHAIPAWIRADRRIFAYRGDGYIKDMGTPERLRNVEQNILSGVVTRKSGRIPRAAVFLDRDGTLNVERGHLGRPEDLMLFPGVEGAIRRLNRQGVLALLVTNQPVIARGEASFEDVARIHRRLEDLLAAGGAYLDGTFFCPHHPDKGFPGERVELKVTCGCRKPATGMIDEACGIFSIDRSRSWMVGDTTLDLECARRAGLSSILVKTGSAGRDGKHYVTPDAVAADLPAAVETIFRRLGLAD